MLCTVTQPQTIDAIFKIYWRYLNNITFTNISSIKQLHYNLASLSRFSERCEILMAFELSFHFDVDYLCLSCIRCFVTLELQVCIVVVVLCVLLSSYVYLLYCVCIAVCFYFRCRTAG